MYRHMLQSHNTPAPTPPNYKKENMLNLEESILLENTKLSFKLQHNLLPPRLHSMLTSDSKMKSLEKKSL